MTSNQIAYAQAKEQKRSNQAREGEAARHNLVQEKLDRSTIKETRRSNKAREHENVRSNKARERENKRSNKAKERETHRSNLANESLQFQRNVETHRTNVVNEGIRQQEANTNLVNARTRRLESNRNFKLGTRRLQQDRNIAKADRKARVSVAREQNATKLRGLAITNEGIIKKQRLANKNERKINKANRRAQLTMAKWRDQTERQKIKQGYYNWGSNTILGAQRNMNDAVRNFVDGLPSAATSIPLE